MADFWFIGEPELLTGFRFAGVDGTACFGRQDSLEAFAAAQSSGVRVVIFSQDVADQIREELVDWQLGGQCPLVVELPPLGGAVTPPKSLVDLIRSAVGISV